MEDKNQAVIDFLLDCPIIQANPLFFNFINAKDKSKQVTAIATNTSINKKYIDGSVLKRYLFSITDFCSVSFQAIPKVQAGTTGPQYISENVADLQLVQDLMNWITEQADAYNFPDFGEDCIVEEMTTTTNMPNLNGVDTQVTPALAKYTITIQIDYLDTSKMLQ